MKILIVVVLLIAAAETRKISHLWSFSDLTSMPVDAITKGLGGDWNGAAQNYAMSKAGLSQSKTVGSYFGQEQPKTPLSGLSSFFGGNNNNAAGDANNQGGLGGLLSRFGGNQAGQPQTPNGAVPNVDANGQPAANNQGGLGGLLSQFNGANNQPQTQPQSNGGLGGFMSNFFNKQNGAPAAQP